MSHDLLTIDVETTALLAAIAAMPDVVLTFTKPAAKVTADNVAREMRARIQRRTRKTADAITVEVSHDGTGYVVYVGSGRQHVGRFLEFGTRYMSKRDFFFPAVRLEEGPHDRRTRDAVQAAINGSGLGD
jgi:HK97 gp10 family phage protein